MECEICDDELEKTFLDKIIGTRVRDEEGTLHIICNECQRDLEMEEIKEKIS